MAAYCRTADCLRQTILRYFGEPDAEFCGHCGNCAQLARPSSDVSDVAVPILCAVQETGQRFGMGTIMDMLAGKETARVRGFDLKGRRTFGALAGRDIKTVRAIASQMVASDYLTVQSGQYPTLALGRKGEAALLGEPVLLRLPEAEPAPAPRAAGGRSAPASARVALGEDDAVLFQRLRQRRMELAQARSVPAFVILTDAALHDICVLRPHTRAEMLRVKGVGESKAEAFGDAFLDVVRAHEAQ